jgi:zinc/manganese transport system permease protein
VPGPPRFSPNLVHDVEVLWQYPFMRHALLAGTAVAVMSACVGWFVVLRHQAYAAHSLAMVAFPGATGAALLGLPAVPGYLLATAVGATVMALLEGRSRQGLGRFRSESAVIGSVQAVALGLGLLFASLYGGFLADVPSFLFGSFLGVSAGETTVVAVVSLATLTLLALGGRPLLFATVDPGVAAAAGVPVGGLSAAFLALVGLAVAGASQFTGVLLVFALLVTPAATAQVVTARPGRSLATAVILGVAVVWAGLATAFFADGPVGFWFTTLGFGAYLVARAGRAAAGTARRRRATAERARRRLGRW